MQDITVIILTKNEERNIEKCIKSAKQIADRIIVVDSGSSDQTVKLAHANGAEVVYHDWLGHARQFNWALDHCSIQTEWVYRLDADERITRELGNEIKSFILSTETEKYSACAVRFQLFFMGQRLKHGGTHRVYVTRLFRYGKAYMEDRDMDERLIVDGNTKQLKGDMIHRDYKSLDEWLIKHISYSQLELNEYQKSLKNVSKVNSKQKQRRNIYYRLPRYIRARLYFWYRYYLQLGFLDGEAGKIFIFLQAYWYRFIVDAKIYETEKKKEDEKSIDFNGEISSGT